MRRPDAGSALDGGAGPGCSDLDTDGERAALGGNTAQRDAVGHVDEGAPVRLHDHRRSQRPSCFNAATGPSWGSPVAGTFATGDAAGEGDVTPKYLPPAGTRRPAGEIRPSGCHPAGTFTSRNARTGRGDAARQGPGIPGRMNFHISRSFCARNHHRERYAALLVMSPGCARGSCGTTRDR
jgi:hypothetical protein